ncbi:isoleucine--tRNA ligase, partial [Patescibacteria group bacterium]|nr:isoleucine--tRNA ligase [Patescibacteria group bacterium]
LNMFQPVTSKVSLPQVEEKILNWWQNNNVFPRSVESRRGGPRFVFYEGPPTANGSPGIHHVLARAYKDIIPRYKTMQGFYVERKAGWDTQGLPVELQAEKELKISGKPEIEKYGIAEFNKKCKESVWKYKKEWEEMTKRIGFWLDMDNPYITYENDYLESLWWIIKQVWDKGLLYKGYKVVPHCPRCGTALSSHEVALGYKEVEEDSVYIKFKVVDEEDTYILSWTTTPWTLPGNVALAVGEDIDYAKVKVDKEIYILAKSIAEKLFEKLKVVKEMKGKDLVGMVYEPLFNIASLKSDKAHKVYVADFVNIEEGTGIVHTAVMYGEDDYQLGERVGLPKYHTVDENGLFTKEVEKWAGQFVKDEKVEQGIVNDLEEKKLLLKSEPYKHSYPFCWRCETPLLYYAKDSWFIRMSKLKEKLIRNNEQINWTPSYIKHGRFGEWLDELKDWAFSRERYWGTPLPIWESDDKDRLCIGSRKDLKSLAKDPKKIDDKFDLHRPFVDDIVLVRDGKEYKRVKEVIDVWFDAGAMPFAQWHYPFANKERIDEGVSFPADYISEAVDQTRGWFYTLLAVATLLGKGTPYKNVTCLGLILDEKGQKMSKSKGNVVDPFTIIRKYGADPLRWYLFTMNQPGEAKLFSEKKLEDVVKKNWLILWNVLTFWKMYAKNFSPSAKDSSHVLDKWITARFNVLVEQVTKNLDNYEVTEAARAMGEFINILSTWYLRRSRARFKKDGDDKQQALHTLHFILLHLSKIMAPFAPMFAESLFKEVNKDKILTSVHLCEWPEVNKAAIDNKLIDIMSIARQAVELGHSLRKENNFKVRQPLSQFIIQTQLLNPEITGLIKDELNVQEVITAKQLPTGKDFVYKETANVKVALDKTITDELKGLGVVREVIRQINAMRKDAQLTIDDLITLYYEVEDEFLEKIITHYKKDICSETLASECLKELPANVDLKTVLDIAGNKIVFGLKKK